MKSKSVEVFVTRERRGEHPEYWLKKPTYTSTGYRTTGWWAGGGCGDIPYELHKGVPNKHGCWRAKMTLVVDDAE